MRIEKEDKKQKQALVVLEDDQRSHYTIRENGEITTNEKADYNYVRVALENSKGYVFLASWNTLRDLLDRLESDGIKKVSFSPTKLREKYNEFCNENPCEPEQTHYEEIACGHLRIMIENMFETALSSCDDAADYALLYTKLHGLIHYE